MTGLGQILISAIVALAGNVTIVALILTMVTCVVLGMGVPTTANYIIMATTCAPILITGMGIEPIAAHMFVFYFGIVPYIFALNPAMLFINTTPVAVVLIVVTSTIGLFGVAAGLEGYMYTHMPIWQRLISIVDGLMLIDPGHLTDLVGVCVVGSIILI